jgi:hypothetical protein
VDDFEKVVAWERFHDDVNVVGHDTPGMQDVALALKIPEGPGDEVCDCRLTEEALAMPGIEELVNPLRVKKANAFLLLGGEFAVCPEGGLCDAFALADPGFALRLGDGIRQPEHDMVNGVIACPMREIFARGDRKAGSQTVPVWFIFKSRARRSGYFPVCHGLAEGCWDGAHWGEGPRLSSVRFQ